MEASLEEWKHGIMTKQSDSTCDPRLIAYEGIANRFMAFRSVFAAFPVRKYNKVSSECVKKHTVK
jgi:hypothetical protein